MRGHVLGVGHIGAMQGCQRFGKHPSCSDDLRGEDGKHVDGLHGGSGLDERSASWEPSWHGDCISDTAWVGSGACIIHSDGTAGVDGMRGDRVEVGDIFALPGDKPNDRSYATGVRDSRRTYGDGKRGRVCRPGEHVDGMETESRGDRIDIGNSVWVRAWDYGAYCDGAGRADGM